MDEEPAAMTDSLNDVLGNYPTGVVIVTAIAADGTPVGLVARAFAPVSPEHSVVSFTAETGSSTFTQVRSASRFCINLIAADGEALCREFTAAEYGGTDPFQAVGWHASASGSPILDGVLGWIECVPGDLIEVADRAIVLGTVADFDAEREFLPLLSFQQGYGQFLPGSLMLSRTDGLDNVPFLVEVAREPMHLLSRDLGAECSLLVASEGEMVFVATSNHSNSSNPTRLGLRAPLVPPIGALFVDSPGAPRRNEWLARVPEHTERAHDLAVEQLRQVQARDWSISLVSDHSVEELESIVTHYARTPIDSTSIAQRTALLRARAASHDLVEIDPNEPYSVLQVSVPVRSPSGALLCVLRLGDLPPGVYGSEVLFWIQQLQETAWTVHQAIAERFSVD